MVPSVATPFGTPVVQADSGAVLTVAEVARRLRVSTATVYAMCERGELPHSRVLNSIRIPAGAVAGLITPLREMRAAQERTPMPSRSNRPPHRT